MSYKRSLRNNRRVRKLLIQKHRASLHCNKKQPKRGQQSGLPYSFRKLQRCEIANIGFTQLECLGVFPVYMMLMK